MTDQPSTVDPNRELDPHERAALITVETGDRLARRAHGLISRGGPEDLRQALYLLEALIGENATRMATAVKRQDVSDDIAGEARDKVRKHLASLEKTSPTQIGPARLTELRAAARQRAGTGGFVDPLALGQAAQVLRRRGEPWAAAVLGRDLSRRSIAFPNLPWLQDNDEYVLIAADAEEDKVAFEEITAD